MERNAKAETQPQWKPQVQRKFTGALAEPLPPIFIWTFSLLDNTASREAAWREREALVEAKRKLVLQEYGIAGEWSPETAEVLARRLLREFVPGFDVADPNKKQPSRPQSWTDWRDDALVHAMTLAAKKHPLLNQQQLAGKLVKLEPWKSFCAEMSNPADTLKRRYQKVKATRPVSRTYQRIYEEEQSGLRPKGAYDEMVMFLFKPEGVIPYR